MGSPRGGSERWGGTPHQHLGVSAPAVQGVLPRFLSLRYPIYAEFSLSSGLLGWSLALRIALDPGFPSGCQGCQAVQGSQSATRPGRRHEGQHQVPLFSPGGLWGHPETLPLAISTRRPLPLSPDPTLEHMDQLTACFCLPWWRGTWVQPEGQPRPGLLHGAARTRAAGAWVCFQPDHIP